MPRSGVLEDGLPGRAAGEVRPPGRDVLPGGEQILLPSEVEVEVAERQVAQVGDAEEVSRDEFVRRELGLVHIQHRRQLRRAFLHAFGVRRFSEDGRVEEKLRDERQYDGCESEALHVQPLVDFRLLDQVRPL